MTLPDPSPSPELPLESLLIVLGLKLWCPTLPPGLQPHTLVTFSAITLSLKGKALLEEYLHLSTAPWQKMDESI